MDSHGKRFNCPNGHGPMELTRLDKDVKFRDKYFTIGTDNLKCPDCGFLAATVEQAGTTQRLLAEAYRRSEGLLSSEEIRNYRNKCGITQNKLAEKIGVGIASIKRWENGLVQSRSMDKLLRKQFGESHDSDDPFLRHYHGGRAFSKSRTKLVLKKFESLLNIILLRENDPNDKMLFATKYLWFADFVAFKDKGKGITGANYAVLPYGPQLNNYRDLVDQIRKASEETAEPLTAHEISVIEQIAAKFPRPQLVYEAAHREEVWSEKKSGETIPYTDAERLTEI